MIFNFSIVLGDFSMIYLQMIESEDDKAKFEEIYLKYKALMFYAANKILHNEQDAEDAVHMAFIKIAENIEKIDVLDCPKARSYIVTIVEHKAIDIYRKKNRYKESKYLEEVTGLEVTYEGDNLLTKSILNLPARYREAILLRYYHGYSVREIAALFDISLMAASKLDQRAKKKLKELCEKEGIL